MRAPTGVSNESINGMAEEFRTLLRDPGVIELPGCYDVLSAIMLERVGYSCVFLSGYGVAASTFGNPDIGLTALPETALMCRNLTARLEVPVIVDADNGYGNEDNVVRTVYELEHAGAAAMVMEDQILPKRCGHTDNKQIVPLPHYLNKLEHALHGRQTPMVIVARTDANIDEGILRAKEFHKAGADVLLIDGLKSLDDVKRVGQEVPGNKQINLVYGGKTPLLSADEFHALGFKIVQYSMPALFLVAQSMKLHLERLKASKHLGSIAEESMKFREFQTLMEDVYKRSRKPVPGDR
jgi:2-methylisocitrate lyase-like PEP mutase family enzyme